MKVALTIAASDSSCGAGTQVDLSVFRELGVYGVCAVTAITVQDSTGVHKVFKLPRRIVAAQIDAAARDLNVGAVKIGMLYSPQVVDQVAERIKRRELPMVVLDPVMRAKHGEVLLTGPALKRLKRALLPLATIVTPNAEEAASLSGIAIGSRADARDAAKALLDKGAKWVLVKGGHVEGQPVDVLTDGVDYYEFGGKRLPANMHGTGCVLSAAIAARLALGDDIPSAVDFAKGYVTAAIERSVALGRGAISYFIGGADNCQWSDASGQSNRELGGEK
jgi:hydroxymethylpyrimidine/phosphomethylpyrimidine kinase